MKGLNEIKPAFGIDEKEYQVLNKVMYETNQFDFVMDYAKNALKKLKLTNLYKTSSLLFYGDTGVGKTTLAVRAALSSQFPFIKLISPKDLVGLSEFEKVIYIKSKFNDAYKSEESIIILDEIESLIEYVDIGPRFSNNILQALKIFIKNESEKNNNKTFVFGTTSLPKVMVDCGLIDCFIDCLEIHKCNKEDYNQLCQQNPIFSKIQFDISMPIKKLLSMLPEADYEN